MIASSPALLAHVFHSRLLCKSDVERSRHYRLRFLLRLTVTTASFLAGSSGFDPRLLEKCALTLEEGSDGKEVVDFKWSAAMNREKERRNKVITLSLLFGTQLFSFMIRVAFGVVAPTLMTLYHLSPKTMGYILSGWNW